MKLSRAALYAVHSSLLLAAHGQQSPIPCRQLAEEGQMPERFLLQVLRMMVNADLLVSTRGVVGGYRLARSPEEITLLDIVEATDGRLEPAPLDMASLHARAETRIMQTLAAAVEGQRRQLADLRLADLLPKERGAPSEQAIAT